jgi:hypothetical protein
MLIRMTRNTINTHITGWAERQPVRLGGPRFTRAARWAAALAVLAVLILVGITHDSAPVARSGQVVVIADATQAAGLDGDVRIAHTASEQLSLTRYFAARGYDIVGVGLDRAIAVDPVAARYPETRFRLR